MTLVVGVVFGIMAEVVYVGIFKIFFLSDGEDLVAVRLRQKLTLFVEESGRSSGGGYGWR